MIGIEITQEIKDQNDVPQSVGTIITRNNYPSQWWVTERVVGGYRNRTDLHAVDGWKDVVQPTVDPDTQVRGGIILDEVNDVFTYEVIDCTQEEIDAKAEEKLQNEEREQIQKHRERADNLLERTRTKMWRRVNKFPDGALGLTKPQVAKLDRWFADTYFSLLVGNFRQARNDIRDVIEQRDDVTGDSTLLEAAGMLDTAQWLRDQIEDYFDNQYDL